MKTLLIVDFRLPIERRAFASSIGNRQSSIGNRVMPTAAKDIFVQNANGLHARPAMQFVDLANSFSSNIVVRRLADPPVEADGKSVMQMIILEATQGTALRIEADGDDAERAVNELAGLFESRFGED